MSRPTAFRSLIVNDTLISPSGGVLYVAGLPLPFDTGNFEASGIRADVITGFTNSDVVVSLADQYLVASDGVRSVLWDARKLHDYNDGLSVDWNDRRLSQVGGTPSLSWNDRLLHNGAGDVTLDWDNRNLIDNSQNPTLNWEGKQLSGVWNVQSLRFPQSITSATAVVSLDWATSNVFHKTLAGNSHFLFANTTDGQTINLVTYTTGGYTVQFPVGVTGVKWQGGVPYSGTSGSAGTGVYDLWTFSRFSGNLFGAVSPNHY